MKVSEAIEILETLDEAIVILEDFEYASDTAESSDHELKTDRTESLPKGYDN